MLELCGRPLSPPSSQGDGPSTISTPSPVPVCSTQHNTHYTALLDYSTLQCCHISKCACQFSITMCVHVHCILTRHVLWIDAQFYIVHIMFYLFRREVAHTDIHILSAIVLHTPAPGMYSNRKTIILQREQRNRSS